MEQRFRLQEKGGGRAADVGGFPLHVDGDPELCRRIREFLGGPVAALGPSLDPDTGERGTRVLTLAPGDPGWLVGCLRRAAQELDLRLTELPLSGR